MWENPSGGAPQHLRKAALNRDHHQCVQCGNTECLEVDHIKNVASGGGHNLNNLQTLCKTCHREKTRSEMRKGHQTRANRAKYPKEQHPGLKT
ncbi:HNH endonuclease [Corynebacterium striatum]|uniref:HNH endonuclease n=1 Tax=Corynebacterium striatum TaxID=43770 RepID=UPI003B637D53